MKRIIILITCIGVILTGCSSNNTAEKGIVKIATKPMSEQLVLGEMLKLLIENETELEVELTHGIGGGTSNIHPALLEGEFDLYPEYTGTAWNYVLKKTEFPSDEELEKELRKEYNEEYDLSWVGMYGFNNMYGLVIRKEIADKYNIKTYSDLASVANELSFGAEYDFFEREDGYDALCETYGFDFASEVDLDIGLKYQALDNKQIDVMVVFTTDGQLSKAEASLLEDDQHFYETYYIGSVVRNDTLEKYPELENVLLQLDNLISDSEMAEMNYQIEVENQDEKEVAKQFLLSKGLLTK